MTKVYDFKPVKRRKRLRLRYLLVILAVLYVSYILIVQQIAINRARTEEAQIKQQIEILKQQNDATASELEQASDDKYIEKLAREKLGLIKPGEIMFIDVNYKEQTADN